MNAHRQPTADTRTLHRLDLPAHLCDTGDAALRRALYVDCETTGLNVEHDQAIELALLPFTYAVGDGRIAEVLHHEAQVHLHDPGRPLDPFITDLTGLTDDDLRGRRIDVDAANALIARSNLIVAHNARFDRPFVERALPATRALPWGCSMRDVPWTAHGCPSAALHCLACHYGVFARDRHRALADCEVGVWLLAQTLPRLRAARARGASRERGEGDHPAVGGLRPVRAQGRAQGARLSLDAPGQTWNRARVVDRARPRERRCRARVAARERLSRRSAPPHPAAPRHRL